MQLLRVIMSLPLSGAIAVWTPVGISIVGMGQAKEAMCSTSGLVALGTSVSSVGNAAPRRWLWHKHSRPLSLERNLLPSTAPTFLLGGMPLYGQVPWAGI